MKTDTDKKINKPKRKHPRLKMSVTYAHLGTVKQTDACIIMQENNPDPTSMFVEHDGEIKEVSRNLVAVTFFY